MKTYLPGFGPVGHTYGPGACFGNVGSWFLVLGSLHMRLSQSYNLGSVYFSRETCISFFCPHKTLGHGECEGHKPVEPLPSNTTENYSYVLLFGLGGLQFRKGPPTSGNAKPADFETTP